MKRLAYTIALLVSLTSATFAHNGENEISVKPEVSLSAEELALEAELSAELEISVEAVLAEVATGPVVTAVKVFDLAGNEVSSQNGEIDFEQIPVNAELVLTEGTTQYYIITE